MGADLLKLLAPLLALMSQPLLAQSSAPASNPPATAARPLSLDDLYSDLDLADAALSPSGRYIAYIVRRPAEDLLVVMDLQTKERKPIQRSTPDQASKKLVTHIAEVSWKSDERLLFRTTVRPRQGVRLDANSSRLDFLGDRLFAANRDGTKVVAMFAANKNAALYGAFNLGAIMSFLPKDPSHILMVVDGWDGRSLFKVDLGTGTGEEIERPSDTVVGWWFDVDGKPVVRRSESGGTVRLSRKESDGKWRKFFSARLREMNDEAEYSHVGPSDQPGKHYVLAHPPGRDRMGLYLYDLEREQFGEPVIENPTYDLISAEVSRDGKKVIGYCYRADVRICNFTNSGLDAHMQALRRYFAESANIYSLDSSEDGTSILLYVEGPRDPPAYYIYLTERRGIDILGMQRAALFDVIRPRATIIRYKARDGVELSGYLTTPASADPEASLPLVLMPHGGPEARDTLSFNRWVQFLVARGYAVFQPNFRGSAGFGRQFAESGYGEWGRKMQNDLSDGVKALVDQGLADPARVCIVGGSYGGYAALAGAALTPDLYKCAVSLAGLSDLEDFIGWRKRNWGAGSEGYIYWLKAIGDPDKDAQRLREVSPLAQAASIRIPVLLIHGTDDLIVPIMQSKAMKRALDKSGRPTELITLKGEGHSYWSSDNEKLALTAIDKFLWQHLGPGFGATAPPASAAATSK